jgi:hypothetical protein
MPSSSTIRFGHWLKVHPFTVILTVVLAVISVVFASRRQSEWQEVYLPAAAHLWGGTDIYRAEDGYLYPPFMALATLPFLAAPTPVARFAWLLLNGAGLIVTLRWAWRLAGGERLEGDGVKLRERFAAILGSLCGVFFIQNCLAHQQTACSGLRTCYGAGAPWPRPGY